MIKTLLSAMMVIGSFVPVFGEVEYEIHTDYSHIDCFRVAGGPVVLELRTYQAAPGKLDALLARLREILSDPIERRGINDLGSWVPADNKDNLLICLLAYREKEGLDAKSAAMPELDEKLVERVERLFVKPTDFSEGFAKIIPNQPQTGVDLQRPEGRRRPRIGKDHLFEMRTYTTTPGHLPNLHARFRDHTMALFKKHGITNLAYFQPTGDQPGAENTLLYFIAHKDAEAATKSWDAFRADPEWVEAKMASEKEAGGSLTAENGVKSVFLKPTDFSPVK